MRTRLALLALFALWGCAPATAAGFVPRVAVRGAIVERRGADPARTDWRVAVDAVWTLDRPVPVARRRALPGDASSSEREGRLAAPAIDPARIACVVPAICAWERRARVRATRRLRAERGGR